MDDTLKQNLHQLYLKHNAHEQLAAEITTLKQTVLEQIKLLHLEGSKFSFGDKQISYHKYVDRGQISQKNVRSALAKHHPELDAEQILANILGERPNTVRENIEILKPRTTSTTTSTAGTAAKIPRTKAVSKK